MAMSDSPSSLPNDTSMEIASAIPRRAKAAKRGKTLQPNFKILIGLTLLTALLLTTFALSVHYLDWLRDRSFELHPLIRGEAYKQVTGFIALAFVLGEMILTIRKRGRTWPIKLKVPGGIPLWRSLHIFCGVGLVAIVLVHTLGATGLNFNAIFLWVFFGVTLTALMGVVAETGILESSMNRFGTLPLSKKPLMKGALIRGLRGIWLLSHIFLVSIFAVMLGVHILLAYYYQ